MTVKKILIVDDSPTERQYLLEMISKLGYQCVLATNGEEGIEKARSEAPDLILMDVVMPGTSGFQATRILSRDAATKHIPVFICSSKSQDTDRIWGMRQGARDYLIKPINPGDLAAKIKAMG
jgi:twitching motility two-component system response regulator PilH